MIIIVAYHNIITKKWGTFFCLSLDKKKLVFPLGTVQKTDLTFCLIKMSFINLFMEACITRALLHFFSWCDNNFNTKSQGFSRSRQWKKKKEIEKKVALKKWALWALGDFVHKYFQTKLVFPSLFLFPCKTLANRYISLS